MNPNETSAGTLTSLVTSPYAPWPSASPPPPMPCGLMPAQSERYVAAVERMAAATEQHTQKLTELVAALNDIHALMMERG